MKNKELNKEKTTQKTFLYEYERDDGTIFYDESPSRYDAEYLGKVEA